MPEIAIVVKAKDEASETLKGVDKALHGLKKAGEAAIIPMGALAAVGTALIAKSVLTAARTEELGVVIENLGRVSGYSEEQLAETEAAIKKLGITTQGAQTVMSRFMGAEIDLADRGGPGVARARSIGQGHHHQPYQQKTNHTAPALCPHCLDRHRVPPCPHADSAPLR